MPSTDVGRRTPLYNPFTEVTSSWAQQSRCACTAVSVRMLHTTPTTTHHPLMYTGDAPPTSQQNVGAISISRRHGHTRNSASTTENKRSKTNGHRITAGQRCREGPAEVASKKAHISPPPLSLYGNLSSVSPLSACLNLRNSSKVGAAENALRGSDSSLLCLASLSCVSFSSSLAL